MKLTKDERSMLFRCEEKLREAKNMLVQFGGVVRGGFGGPHDTLKGTGLHKLTEELDTLERDVGKAAMSAGGE